VQIIAFCCTAGDSLSEQIADQIGGSRAAATTCSRHAAQPVL